MNEEFEWLSDPVEVFGSMVDGYEAYIRAVIRDICNYYVPQIEAWMKQNAKWEDQTGNARQTMYAELQEMLYTFIIRADYGMDYGVFLELANSGRFAVVAPAMDFFTPQIFKAIQGAIGT